MEKYHGNTVEYWKQNADEDFLTTPISVLRYITVLEEQAKQLRKQAVSSSVCHCERCEDIYRVEVYKCGKCNLKVWT